MKDPLVAVNVEDEVRVLQKESPNLVPIQVAFIDFMANPESDTSTPGVQKFCTEYNVPIHTVNGWRKSYRVQELIASRIRDSMYQGEYLSEAYKRMMAMLGDPNVGDNVKATILTTIAKLDMKRMEILARLALAASRKRQGPGREVRPIEDAVGGKENGTGPDETP